MYNSLIKPSFDRVFAFFMLICFSPIIILIYLVNLIVISDDPIFVQNRPGLNGELFKIYKFKTMNDKKDASGNLLADHKRITPFGKFLRKTSLDELLQLFNVLLGQMSFVGPRPLLPEYLTLYSLEEKKRHKVKPGITGWAQVNGRNSISWKEKFNLDKWYVENCSIALDLKIIFLTFKKVLKSEDVNSTDKTTMEPYNGKN